MVGGIARPRRRHERVAEVTVLDTQLTQSVSEGPFALGSPCEPASVECSRSVLCGRSVCGGGAVSQSGVSMTSAVCGSVCRARTRSCFSSGITCARNSVIPNSAATAAAVAG